MLAVHMDHWQICQEALLAPPPTHPPHARLQSISWQTLSHIRPVTHTLPHLQAHHHRLQLAPAADTTLPARKGYCHCKGCPGTLRKMQAGTAAAGGALEAPPASFQYNQAAHPGQAEGGWVPPASA